MNHIKKECVAMLLAGGQGSRLYALTQEMAKPAVPYGGKYRIIDFPLSNCVNSGIDTVGVLTQYQPLVLNEYIGNGQPWGLDRAHGGVHVLPPYETAAGKAWYSGTAKKKFLVIIGEIGERADSFRQRGIVDLFLGVKFLQRRSCGEFTIERKYRFFKSLGGVSISFYGRYVAVPCAD